MGCMYTYHMQCWRQGQATCLLDAHITAFHRSLHLFEKSLQLHASSFAVFWHVVSAFVASIPDFPCATMSGSRHSLRLSCIVLYRSHCSGSQFVMSGSLSESPSLAASSFATAPAFLCAGSFDTGLCLLPFPSAAYLYLPALKAACCPGWIVERLA